MEVDVLPRVLVGMNWLRAFLNAICHWCNLEISRGKTVVGWPLCQCLNQIDMYPTKERFLFSGISRTKSSFPINTLKISLHAHFYNNAEG